MVIRFEFGAVFIAVLLLLHAIFIHIILHFFYYKSLLKGIFYKRLSSLQTNFVFKYARVIAFIPVLGIIQMTFGWNFTWMSLLSSKLQRVMI